MRIVGIMPVRNEAWCIGFTLRIALRWCDAVVVADHGSTDGTRAILDELAREVAPRLIIREDRNKHWREMEQRQQLLMTAREHGASHIAMIDADEFLTADIVDAFPNFLRDMPDTPNRHFMVELPGYNVRYQGSMSTTGWYHSNGVWGNRWFPVAFVDNDAAHWAGDRFHHRQPMGVKWWASRPIRQGCGGIIHLWGASERRLYAKHALYKITERLRWPHKTTREIDDMYSLAIVPRERWSFEKTPDDWLSDYTQLGVDHLRLDEEPWQVAEVRRLYQEYGADRFIGLDLFGVENW